MELFETEFERPGKKAYLSIMEEMYVEKGTIEDWHLLEHLHYKGTGTLRPGYHFVRLVFRDEVVGVIVFASVGLGLKERHVMFPALKSGKDSRIGNQRRTKWLNANMSVLSRCVVDTQFRGAGIAYRFANIGSRFEPKRYVEIQSSMSKFNSFAQRAGFVFVPPMKSLKFDIGMKFFKRTFASDPADTESILKEIDSLPGAAKERVIADMRATYKRHSAIENTGKGLIKNADGVAFKDSRIAKLPVRELLKQLQQMVLASPLYGVYTNPDLSNLIPERVPLLAFDKVSPKDPMFNATH